MGIPAISLDPVDHDLDFIICEEELRLVGIFGEVNQENESHDCDNGRDDAFPDELFPLLDFNEPRSMSRSTHDPTPAFKSCCAIHLLQAIGEHSAKSTNTVADQVKEGVSLGNFPAYIPHAHQE